MTNLATINFVWVVHGGALKALNKQPQNIKQLIPEIQLENLQQISSYAREKGYLVRLIWHYFPYKDDEYHNQTIGQEAEHYQSIFSDFTEEIGKICPDMMIINLLELYKGMLNFQDHHLLRSIANNTHYGFASVIDAIKLFPHVYEHDKCQLMVTIDFDVTKQQLITLVEEFHDRKINLMLGADYNSQNELGHYCVENNICITNSHSECCKRVIGFIDQNIAIDIEQSKFSKLPHEIIYTTIVFFALREHSLLTKEKEERLLQISNPKITLSLEYIDSLIQIRDIDAQEIKKLISDGGCPYRITRTWMSESLVEESISSISL